jgi:hypothetical protein
MGNIPKDSALYVYRPETNQLCRECAFVKEISKGKSGCAFFGSGTAISPESGSCGYWSHAEPKQFEIPWMGIFTKQELGYAENRGGFGCWRCEYFAVGKNDCSKVDKNSLGDTPGEVNPRGCCSLWDGDDKRSKMTAPQLVQLLASASKPKPTVPSLRAMMGAR